MIMLRQFSVDQSVQLPLASKVALPSSRAPSASQRNKLDFSIKMLWLVVEASVPWAKK